VEAYFGSGGLLARHVDGFEPREHQLEMARSVARSLEDEIPLLVEAGTGTGKTWAYLVPAILSGRKIVVSTGTKTLQDQIFDHDIPLLRKLFFKDLRAVCLKGRKNYLCLRRFKAYNFQPNLWQEEEAGLLARLAKWVDRTRTGDRAEIAWLPDRCGTWSEVSSGSDQCLGQKCGEFGRCFLNAVRHEAQEADLLVVNHHLFFANLSLRKEGYGEVVPEYEGVIFDEAHEVEDVAGMYFCLSFNSFRVNELVRDIRRELAGIEGAGRRDDSRIADMCFHLEREMHGLHRWLLKKNEGKGRAPLDLRRLGEQFSEAGRAVAHVLGELAAALGPFTDDNPGVEGCERRVSDARRQLLELLEQSDPSLVYWYECTSAALFLNATPLEVAPILREHLFEATPATVLTSATLSTAGSFAYFRERLGMPDQGREALMPSPFAYEKQALLYIPERFPEPRDPQYGDALSRQALEILLSTQGRALFLFTSYQNLHRMCDYLKDRLPFPLLVQGDRPKRVLLSRFRERVESVLLATGSFWQGIDVPGEALSCVLIDKLPFDVPDDPLVAARMKRIAEDGRSAFYHYQIPRAVVHLKQGVGRLIRSSKDRGILAIFDVRLRTKSYGRVFLKSLPPYRLVGGTDELRGFLDDSPPSPNLRRPSPSTSELRKGSCQRS